MADFPPIYSVPYTPETLTLLKFVSDLSGSGKKNKNDETYWIARVRDAGGTEYSLFINPPERDDFLEDAVTAGDTFEIKRVGKGRAGVNMVRRVEEAPPKETYLDRAQAAVPEGKAYPNHTVEAPDGWVTSSFDNKLTPCLRTVPTLNGGPQEEIFRRLCNGVGDELADVARAKVLRMAEMDQNSKLTTAQAVALAPTFQASFATLVISWKDLGYPVTPSERARIELGGDADVEFG